MPAKPVFHRAPLMANSFAPLPLGCVRPGGWLRAQLTLQADALRDALAARWPDLADPAAWREPGEADWPRDIALLAAALPLGRLLEDPAWIGAADRRIAWAAAAQREDGCLAPAGDDDAAWCARAELMQLFVERYGVTADGGMLTRMLRYCKYAWERLAERPLGPRAAARAGELLAPVLWLYRVTGRRFLLELARDLRRQGFDWTAFCHTMPIRAPMEKQLPWRALREGMQAAQADVRSYHERLYWQAEAVDLAAGLRTPALVAQSTGGIKHAEAFDVGYAKLMRYHGLANGLFSGDDLLAGASPSRGTVCAAIGELMTTLETLLAAQGRAIHGDLLERLAYNALPAAYAGNMRLQQRVQQPNQVDIGPANREWYSAEPEANAFDACALDAGGDALHHGFPRFAASLWMAAPDEGLAAVAYAPCTVRARAGGAVVCIDVETGYPFEDVVRLRVHAREPVEFPLRLRVPDWAEGASLRVNGEAANSDCPPGDFAVVRRVWQDGDTVVLTFPMRVALSAWYHGSGALMRGPLLLALAGGGAGAPVRWPEDQAWAYALLPGEGSCVRCDPTQAAPFGHGLPLIVEVKAVPLPDWKLKQGSADAPPIAPVVDRGQAVSLPLIPYGATALRICQFPLA